MRKTKVSTKDQPTEALPPTEPIATTEEVKPQPRAIHSLVEVRFSWRDCLALLLGGRAIVELDLVCETDPGKFQLSARAHVRATPMKVQRNG